MGEINELFKTKYMMDDLSYLLLAALVLSFSTLVGCTLMHRKKVSEAFYQGKVKGEETLRSQLDEVREEFAGSKATCTVISEQLSESKAELVTRQEKVVELESQAAAMNARAEENRKAFEEKEAFFKETGSRLKQEFEALANNIFEKQGVKQRESLNIVLNPFKEQIGDFKKKVEEVYLNDTKERASLLVEVKNLQTASEKINEEAGNLTKALKGDKKLQGNWGELVLERILEESSLRKGHEYFLQSSYRSEAGDLKRPDVIIRLPDDKDVVVDSKMSLNAYEEALSSESDEQREALLNQHLTNIKNHVKRLSEQDYDRLPNIRSLDFVLLFIPIESAFTLAMQTDHTLFTEALVKRIVIVSPTNLMMTLRIIRNVWSYDKQSKNTQEIVRKAGALYDKLRLVVEEMDALGKQLNTANKTYESAYGKLTSGKGNLVRQVEGFRELGAIVKKPMPPQIVDRSED